VRGDRLIVAPDLDNQPTLKAAFAFGPDFPLSGMVAAAWPSCRQFHSFIR
jgi:hypothetical protein